MQTDPDILIEAPEDDPFARIPHRILNDETIPAKAKLVLIYLLSKPPGWKVQATDIARRCVLSKSSVWAALRELRDSGYAAFRQLRSGNRISGGQWRIARRPRFLDSTKRQELTPKTLKAGFQGVGNKRVETQRFNGQGLACQNLAGQTHSKNDSLVKMNLSKNDNPAAIADGVVVLPFIPERGKLTRGSTRSYSRPALPIPRRVAVPAPVRPRAVSKAAAGFLPEAVSEDLQSLQTISDAALQHTAARRNKKIAALKPGGCFALWQDSCREAMPDALHLSVTQKDAHILRAYQKRTGMAAGAFCQFIAWVCQRWTFIRAESFTWMTKGQGAPQVPSIPFFVRHHAIFEQAWGSKTETERLENASLQEREIARLRRVKGMSQAAAEKHVNAQEEKTVQAQESKAAAAKLIQAANALKTAELREAQAKPDRERWKEMAKARACTGPVPRIIELDR